MSSYRKDGEVHTIIFLSILVFGLYEKMSSHLIQIVSVLGFMLLLYLVVRLASRRTGFKEVASMTGLEFEYYVANLLKAKGFDHVRLTEKYDLGVDIVAKKDGISYGIQVKRYSGLVGANAIRQVVTALPLYSCSKAMVITNSTFSRPAKTLAEANGCLLVNGHSLNSMKWLPLLPDCKIS